jgi:negative regulator of sigma E activity
MRGMVMSKRKEKISAFLDNDMHRDELMSFSLSAETEDAKTVQHYQIIGDALRGEMSDASFVDVSLAVREALAGENIADSNHVNQRIKQQTTASANKADHVVSPTWDLSAWFRPVAGMAFAVLVAVVMVMTVSEQDTGTATPVATNTDKQPVIQSTTVAADDAVKNSKTLNANNVETNQKADPYINQHLEYATQDALQGRLPYVRAVSFETEK